MAAQAADGGLLGRCQARPKAGRRWQREDPRCANSASTRVPFRGHDMPVCRMHERTYARWGAEAAENAAVLWGW
jgi:hypothetical protein